MKILPAKILTYSIITAFVLYWAGMVMLAMPSNYPKNLITKKAPRFKTIFGYSWNLFTPAHTYSNRLYFIIRDTGITHHSDTLEVLEGLALQKRLRAPFNQKEFNIDHLVNANVASLTRLVWIHKNKPTASVYTTKDSAYIAGAIKAVAKMENYNRYLVSLTNYLKWILKEKQVITAGKEVKLLIKEKSTLPFEETGNKDFLSKEVLVWETPFEPLYP